MTLLLSAHYCQLAICHYLQPAMWMLLSSRCDSNGIWLLWHVAIPIKALCGISTVWNETHGIHFVWYTYHALHAVFYLNRKRCRPNCKLLLQTTAKWCFLKSTSITHYLNYSLSFYLGHCRLIRINKYKNTLIKQQANCFWSLLHSHAQHLACMRVCQSKNLSEI